MKSKVYLKNFVYDCSFSLREVFITCVAKELKLKSENFERPILLLVKLQRKSDYWEHFVPFLSINRVNIITNDGSCRLGEIFVF